MTAASSTTRATWVAIDVAKMTQQVLIEGLDGATPLDAGQQHCAGH